MSGFKGSLTLVTLGGIVLLLLLFFLPRFLASSYDSTLAANALGEQKNIAESPKPLPVAHLETPEPLKGIYMTACVAGTTSWRESLKKLIEMTELNAVVIDIKDYSGNVSFREGGGCFVKDFREFINALHNSNIYVIGRISVFQDPKYTKLHPELAVKKKSDGGVWKDHKGLSFIDVGAKPYWDYIVGISEDAYALGFDELNYDYVRYPSDGDMKNTLYTWSGTTTKPVMLKTFFNYLHDSLEDTDIKTSVDLFGMTTTVETDMNIGQVLENALPYFDYIAPMVYPSHYPAKWNGFANPAEHPYEVIKIAMSGGVKREQNWLASNNLATSTTSKLRPWLQDFNLGATYGPDKVKAQIQATYDVGLTSWMLWDAANTYTKESLLPE